MLTVSNVYLTLTGSNNIQASRLFFSNSFFTLLNLYDLKLSKFISSS